MSTELSVIKEENILKLDEAIKKGLSAQGLTGFHKAYEMASAIDELKLLLTPQYMKPIMALMNNKLGFKTDKNKAGGDRYSEETVQNCLIEAVLYGVQPVGNQYNIIAGQSYITKEGFGYLLANFSGLRYKIAMDLPRIGNGNTSAAITAKISWTINGVTDNQELPIPVKMDAYTTTDAIIGKATRKARHWLYQTITGSELPEGEMDFEAEVISSKINKVVSVDEEDQNPATFKVDEKEIKPTLPEDALQALKECKTQDDVTILYDSLTDLQNNPEFIKAVAERKLVIKSTPPDRASKQNSELLLK